jgi:hypothetical protein
VQPAASDETRVAARRRRSEDFIGVNSLFGSGVLNLLIRSYRGIGGKYGKDKGKVELRNN